MRRRRRRRRLLVTVALTLLIAGTIWLLVSPHFTAQKYASFTSPDGRYRVAVLRTPEYFGLMPGQSGDSPGIVRLYDRNGTLLDETTVPMVQLVDQVYWNDHEVRIKLVATWNLPSKVQTRPSGQ